ncbi:dCTP deaminase [Candidatus Nomurabacteria bacterium]|nr:dCTP deaminase [Candidatus Kaiserbacteria bacterium]MCB9810372.1 dCTP deaminase [Candidatus Nomurabacteria bacterium]MCB9818046.1 dCTP deaminase [Candidatus Nomurabacteria bacterium]
MFLSDIDILKEVQAGKITLEPFTEDRLQPATYDICLGNTFIINDAHSTKAIDPGKGIFPNTQTIEVEDGEEFVLHPGVSILGYSKERFGSEEYLIEVNGKSSLARIGLIVHNSASIVNPGHYLNIALELCNLNNVPIVLRPGMEIAQLSFSTLSSHTKRDYKDTGRYNADNIKGYVPPKKK